MLNNDMLTSRRAGSGCVAADGAIPILSGIIAQSLSAPALNIMIFTLLNVVLAGCLFSKAWSVYVATTSTTYPFSTATPAGFTWEGGASLNEVYGDPDWSLGFTTLHISGDAGGGGRGFESSFTVTGHTIVAVSFYNGVSCSDPGLAVFPTQNSWSWDVQVGRIAAQMDCADPYLFGETNQVGSCQPIVTGVWYTFALGHNPAAGSSYMMVFSGKDADVLSATPICTQSLAESFPVATPVKFGLAADSDTTTVALSNLVVHEGVMDAPTSQPTSQPTNPTSQPTSQPTNPTSQPTTTPSSRPTGQPSNKPTSRPTTQPSCRPTGQPTGQPSRQPTSKPSGQPTRQPTGQPSRQPSSQPSGQPTSAPSRFAKKRSFRLPRSA